MLMKHIVTDYIFANILITQLSCSSYFYVLIDNNLARFYEITFFGTLS